MQGLIQYLRTALLRYASPLDILAHNQTCFEAVWKAVGARRPCLGGSELLGSDCISASGTCSSIYSPTCCLLSNLLLNLLLTCHPCILLLFLVLATCRTVT